MSETLVTTFLSAKASVHHGAPPIASLYVQPEGLRGPSISFLMRSDLPLDEQAKIADRVLAGVQSWRDTIADRAERERTAETELAAARAEIALLKSEREDSAEEDAEADE